jgi:cytochrome c oxidase cbb3-type subunit 3
MIGRLLGTLAVGLALAGCGQPERAAERLGADHEQGRRVYNSRCYFCHGYSGDARTLAARFLSPAPRDFTREPGLDASRVIAAVREGIAGTAMKPFSGTLSEREIERVARFVIAEFVTARAQNTRYHTAENGWPGHERHAAAFPFATGAIALDRPWAELSEAEREGKRLFMGACISCHDRSRVADAGPAWELRAMSWPPGNYVREGREPEGHHHEDEDDPFELHEAAPRIAGLTPHERRGEAIFQANCAFCHAADGTGRNWIGAFLEPHPADFSRADVARRLTRNYVKRVTREGIEGTSMPAWQNVLSPAEIAAVAAYMGRAFPSDGRYTEN